jgi:type IX secretion system PorP/SprF family membrane protein
MRRAPHYYTLCLFAFIQALASNCAGQDVHATQFYNAPYLINPGLVGQFDGQQRYMLYQRTQWKSITIPYKSVGLGAELRHIKLKKIHSKLPNIHSGLVFITDKAGDSQFRTSSFLVQLGMPFQQNNWQFNPAIGLGLMNMAIDRSQLYFDRNWNGQVFDPQANNGEVSYTDGYTRPQINLGLSASKSDGFNHYTFGIALFNLQRPRQNFIQGAEVNLQRRISLHSQVLRKISEEWSIEPLLLMMFQGPYRSINPGVRMHYNINNPGVTSRLYAGFVGRTRDAGNLIIGGTHDQWDIGLSYDINMSKLIAASNGRGGLELTAIYIVPAPRQITQYKACRKWM